MTTPETSAKTESAGTLFQALQSAGVEPDLAYRADDEVRNRAGQNVIAVIGAKMDALNNKMDALNKEHGARMDAQAAEIASNGARIDDLRVLMLRVIWPLIILLAVPIFGELYRTLSSR